MHLDAEGIVGRNELDEEWEIRAVDLEVLLANEIGTEFFDELTEGPSVIFTTDHGGFVTGNTADFPTFADGIHALDVLEGYNVLAAPKGRLHDFLELEHGIMVLR